MLTLCCPGVASSAQGVVQALSGSAGSVMTLTAQANDFQNGATGTAGINVNWNGTLTGNIQGNTFAGTGGSNTGVFERGFNALRILAVAAEAVFDDTGVLRMSPIGDIH